MFSSLVKTENIFANIFAAFLTWLMFFFGENQQQRITNIISQVGGAIHASILHVRQRFSTHSKYPSMNGQRRVSVSYG